MNKREVRRKVLIKTRMCVGSAWSDAAVLNISSRGLLLSSNQPSPKRGAYLEVRRGPHIVVGRVIWSDGHCFGVKAQDCIEVEDFVRNKHGKAVANDVPPAAERRAAPRGHEHRHEQHRNVARTLQFASFAIIGAAAAMFAFGSVARLFAMPLASVETILSR